MTKAEQRQIDIVKKYHRMGHPDTAAQLRTVAETLGLTSNPNFII